MSETACEASSTLWKTPSSVLTSSVSGVSLAITLVAIPIVPSEPQKRPVRS